LAERVSQTLGRRITKELRNRNMTVSDFVRQLEVQYGTEIKIPGYNHILRVCKGETYPGPNLLPTLCDFLGIDAEEASDMVKRDKAINSGTAELLTRKDAQLLKFEAIWNTLSQNSRNELFMMAEMKSQVEGLK
jgi:transcriptional regulator with XRE-family HTH domain